jgi:hypothetical protein
MSGCALGRAQIMELFHDVTYQTSCGQLIDLITAPIGQVRCASTLHHARVRSRPRRLAGGPVQVHD